MQVTLEMPCVVKGRHATQKVYGTCDAYSQDGGTSIPFKMEEQTEHGLIHEDDDGSHNKQDKSYCFSFWKQMVRILAGTSYPHKCLRAGPNGSHDNSVHLR